MASSLLRRRFSNFSVSRHIYDKFESFPLEFKLGLLACQCDCSRQFSSGASSPGFDFTDLTPVDVDDDISAQGLVQFAQTYAKKGIVNLREIFTPGTLKVPKTPAAMQELESIHKVLELYVWLSYRLDDSFPDREMAASQKSICSMLIEEFLEQYGWQ